MVTNPLQLLTRPGQTELNVNLDWDEPEELMVTHCKEYSVAKH